jgi:hypothetical protein
MSTFISSIPCITTAFSYERLFLFQFMQVKNKADLAEFRALYQFVINSSISEVEVLLLLSRVTIFQ